MQVLEQISSLFSPVLINGLVGDFIGPGIRFKVTLLLLISERLERMPWNRYVLLSGFVCSVSRDLLRSWLKQCLTEAGVGRGMIGGLLS